MVSWLVAALVIVINGYLLVDFFSSEVSGLLFTFVISAFTAAYGAFVIYLVSRGITFSIWHSLLPPNRYTNTGNWGINLQFHDYLQNVGITQIICRMLESHRIFYCHIIKGLSVWKIFWSSISFLYAYTSEDKLACYHTTVPNETTWEWLFCEAEYAYCFLLYTQAWRKQGCYVNIPFDSIACVIFCIWHACGHVWCARVTYRQLMGRSKASYNIRISVFCTVLWESSSS